MSDLNDMTMDEKKQAIQLHMSIFKNLLKETGLAIAFDKENDRFIFLEREYYIQTNKMKGFQIDFMELTY
jgi:hypothetical protein